MKRNGLFAVIALALGTMGVISVAQAQDTGAAATTGSLANPNYSNWYIVPRIGVVVGDSDRQVQVDPVYGLGVGFWVNPSFTMDLEATTDNADYKDSSTRAGKQWETIGLDVSGRWYFRAPTQQWRPYIMAGAGMWRHAAVAGDSGWGPGVTAGVGVLYNVSDRVALRGELAARWYRDTGSAEATGFYPNSSKKSWVDALATVGVVFNMSHPAPPPPPVTPPPPISPGGGVTPEIPPDE
jgi:OOP family OmpA-OmpF porin